MHKQSKVYLIEPIMSVEVITPEDYNGDVIGNLNSRRGQICDSELKGNAYSIKANVPLSEMFGYINDLRGRTQGRATFSMSFSFYDKVPSNIQESLLNEELKK
jgi:elongation factor G